MSIEEIKDMPVATPIQGIAAIALNMALQYHRINTVQDGALYQQYKLEGRNMVNLDLAMVFDTAIEIERHLIAANERVADMIVGMVADAVIEEVEK